MRNKLPILMAEEYLANSQFSIARYYGGIQVSGQRYIIVNKHGQDIFECSSIAEKEGREKAIEPGEPCDLILQDFQPLYRKLGRDRLMDILKKHPAKDMEDVMRIMKEEIRKLDLNELRDKAYQCAIAHGWHEEEHSNNHYLCLIISELMEAVQADRKGKRANVAIFNEWQGNNIPISQETSQRRFIEDYDEFIKGSVEEELSDAIIRLLDLAGLRNIRLFNYNNISSDTCGYSGKALTDAVYDIIDVMIYYHNIHITIPWTFKNIFSLCKAMNIDIEWFIEQKMKYNELRPYKH